MRACSRRRGRRSLPISAPKANCGRCAAPKISSNFIPTLTHLFHGRTGRTSDHFWEGMMIASRMLAGAATAAVLTCAGATLAADNAQVPPFAFMDGGWQAMGADFL